MQWLASASGGGSTQSTMQVFAPVRDARGELVDFRLLTASHSPAGELLRCVYVGVREAKRRLIPQTVFDQLKRVLELGTPLSTTRRSTHRTWSSASTSRPSSRTIRS